MRIAMLVECGLLSGASMFGAAQLWHPVTSLVLVGVAYGWLRLGAWTWEVYGA
jgi:hypothetical protein